jgi:hypothetical protein
LKNEYSLIVAGSINEYIKIKIMADAKVKVDISNLPTNWCSKDFELSSGASFLYKSFEKLDVAIIDKAVIVKPIVTDRKVKI